MRRRAYLSLTLAVFVLAATPALASPTPPTPLNPPPDVPATEVTKRLNNLKTDGAAEIDRRLNSLKDLSGDLADSTVMPSADKDAFAQQIDAETKALGELKTRLAARTDLPAARTDAVAIVTDYSVYGILLPKVRLAIAADRLEVTAASFDDAVRLANLKVKQAGANGAIDRTVALTGARDTVTRELASARAEYDDMSGRLRELTGDYAAQQAALATNLASIKAARADLAAARVGVNDMTAAIASISAR